MAQPTDPSTPADMRNGKVTLGVVGTGVMGRGIASLLSESGRRPGMSKTVTNRRTVSPPHGT